MELQQKIQTKSLSKKRFNLRDKKAGKNHKLGDLVVEEEDKFENAEESSATVNTESQEGKKPNQQQTNGRVTRNKAPQDYKKMFHPDVFSDDDDFVPKNKGKAKKRDLKRKLKVKKGGRFNNYENIGAQTKGQKTGERKVLDGVSIFDLIIPWKEKISGQPNQIGSMKKQPSNASSTTQTSLSSFLSKNKGEAANKADQVNGINGANSKAKSQVNDLVAQGLAQIVQSKEPIVKTNFDKYAKNVEAILINPCWQTQKDKNGKVKGVTMEEFQKLNFSKDLMIDGLVFVWVEKDIIYPVIKFFETQSLFYVENVCWVMLDQTKKQEVEATQSIEVSPAYVRDDYQYVRKSHKTLLMFRRMHKKNGNPLELRHQRTCDVCFDFVETDVHNYKPNEYIYKLIETLLPQASIDEEKKHVRLVELWAHDSTPRKGWIKFIE